MRLLHYVELENFKRFGDRQRIELDQPAVLIGPNNTGKTSVIQALALWSQAVRAWYAARKDSTATQRTGIALNRLAIVAVPVTRTRMFWHRARVRKGNLDIPMIITVGVATPAGVRSLAMRFRNQGNDLVYCEPLEGADVDPDLLRVAANIAVELLYPMSGLEVEEPVLQPGRIDVLLGQGQTAQVLRNLCLLCYRNSMEDWRKIQRLMARLFTVELSEPHETVRGSIGLHYREPDVSEPLDLSSAGRGFQQMLLLLAYLYTHKRSVLLVDEPDAHLEILRQRQVYLLLREIATDNDAQVVLVTHSEVILDEALDRNLTLILDGKADDLAQKQDIRNSLKHFGTAHYVRARQAGYVLYIEGSTDLAMLRALAERLRHPSAAVLDERVNAFYVQDNYPDRHDDAEFDRVEGGFGIPPKKHFDGLRALVPGLRGLAILDSDGRRRLNEDYGALVMTYWLRYELENYVVSPEVLRAYALSRCDDLPLFGGFRDDIRAALDDTVRDDVFDGDQEAFETWSQAEPRQARLIWTKATENRKLSAVAEAYFRRLATRTRQPMLLRKGELHRLVQWLEPDTLPAEIAEKLARVQRLIEGT